MSLRILHIALGMPEFDRCAREMGHTVTRVQHRNNPRWIRELHDACNRQAYDLCFAQLQAPNIMTPELWGMVKSTGAFIVEWCGDVREPLPYHYVDHAPYVDVTAFTNMPDVEEMRSRGHRSEYLQIAVDETFYTPGEARERKGVVFLGNNYVGRFPESESRSKMVEAMRREFGPLFKVYGNGWGHGVTRTTPEKEREIYRGALVALNWDHFIRPYFASDRILRAQACGCMVVTQEYEGRRDEHPFAVAVTSIPNAVSAVHGLMEGAELATPATKYTHAFHTWHSRINTMEQWLSSKGPSA